MKANKIVPDQTALLSNLILDYLFAIAFLVGVNLFWHNLIYKCSLLISCILDNFDFFFVVRLFFSKSTFLQYFFRNTIRVSNSLDQDQAGCFVGPDLGSNCLQRLSAEDKYARS